MHQNFYIKTHQNNFYVVYDVFKTYSVRFAMHRTCNPPKQCMHGLSSPELEASISPFAATCSCQDLAQTFWKNYEAHYQSKCSGSSWFFIVLSPSKGRACTPCTLKNRTLWFGKRTNGACCR